MLKLPVSSIYRLIENFGEDIKDIKTLIGAPFLNVCLFTRNEWAVLYLFDMYLMSFISSHYLTDESGNSIQEHSLKRINVSIPTKWSSEKSSIEKFRLIVFTNWFEEEFTRPFKGLNWTIEQGRFYTHYIKTLINEYKLKNDIIQLLSNSDYYKYEKDNNLHKTYTKVTKYIKQLEVDYPIELTKFNNEKILIK